MGRGGGREKFWRLLVLELAPSAYGGFGAYGDDVVMVVWREASLDSLDTDCVRWRAVLAVGVGIGEPSCGFEGDEVIV